MSSFLVFGVRGDDNRCLTKIGKLRYHTSQSNGSPHPSLWDRYHTSQAIHRAPIGFGSAARFRNLDFLSSTLVSLGKASPT